VGITATCPRKEALQRDGVHLRESLFSSSGARRLDAWADDRVPPIDFSANLRAREGKLIPRQE